MTNKRTIGLVLSRKIGEAVQIGDDILVIVDSRKSGYTRLRIIAPEEIEVHRKEIYDQLTKKQNPLQFTPMVGDGE